MESQSMYVCTPSQRKQWRIGASTAMRIIAYLTAWQLWSGWNVSAFYTSLILSSGSIVHAKCIQRSHPRNSIAPFASHSPRPSSSPPCCRDAAKQKHTSSIHVSHFSPHAQHSCVHYTGVSLLQHAVDWLLDADVSINK